MDHNFTELVGKWLETPTDERDYEAGALYLLKLSGNAIMYRNVTASIDKHKTFIEYQLQKYYNFRVQDLTHAQVVEMESKAEEIVAEHISIAAEVDEVPHKGKRSDHELLPEDIQAKYVENLSLLQRMRELHLRLRTLSTENSTCPDSERYPFLRELIELDKKLHANWDTYDHYIISSDTSSDSDATPVASTKKSSKKKASTAK
jgi:hypothetical protein